MRPATFPVPITEPEIAPDPGVQPGVADPVGPGVVDPVPPDETPLPDQPAPPEPEPAPAA